MFEVCSDEPHRQSSGQRYWIACIYGSRSSTACDGSDSNGEGDPIRCLGRAAQELNLAGHRQNSQGCVCTAEQQLTLQRAPSLSAQSKVRSKQSSMHCYCEFFSAGRRAGRVLSANFHHWPQLAVQCTTAAVNCRTPRPQLWGGVCKSSDSAEQSVINIFI